MKSNFKPHCYISKKGEKAMMSEINRQTAVMTKDMERSLDVLVLYILAKEFHFGKKRALQFIKSMSVELDELSKHYELEDKEQAWLAEKKLKEDFGIDIDVLYSIVKDAKY